MPFLRIFKYRIFLTSFFPLLNDPVKYMFSLPLSMFLVYFILRSLTLNHRFTLESDYQHKNKTGFLQRKTTAHFSAT